MNRSPRMSVMQSRRRPHRLLAMFAVALSCSVQLTGCAGPGATPEDGQSAAAAASAAKAAPKPAASPAAERRDVPEAPPSPAQQALASGIEAYNKGDFNNAIKRLSAPEIANADKPTQLSALKYSAFSYCVTKRQTQCTQQFVKAFKLDRSFELAPGEKGHPLWTQAFERAKKTK